VYMDGRTGAQALSTRAEPISFRAVKDLAGPKKMIIKIAL
jgi:hypothetical protein